MKTIITLLICALLLTSCCPSMTRIAGFINDILARRVVTLEATRTVEITPIVTQTSTPTPGCTAQPTSTPIPVATQQPGGDHRFIVTKLPP